MAANLLREYLNAVQLMESMNYGDMFTQFLNIIKQYGDGIKDFTVTPPDADERRYLDDLVKQEQQNINYEIKWAKRYLKKNNIIVWWLRWFRIYRVARFEHTMNLSEVTPKPYNPYTKYLASLAKEANSTLSSVAYLSRPTAQARTRDFLEHISTVPVPAIRNYDFGWKPPEEVYNELFEIEKSWKNQADRLIPIEHDEGTTVVLDCGDGYKWVSLNKHYCDKEARAMGHCGNGGGHRSDTIYSLRRIVKRGSQSYWEPFLTFIVDSHGFLGESKGRGNEAPVEKYHPQIIKFLLSPIIKGIKGGGYLPENNFKMSDLTNEEQEKIYQKKPELAPISWRYEREGMTDNLAVQITILFESNGLDVSGWSKDYKFFHAREFSEWRDILEEYGDDKAKYYVNKVEDGVFDWDFNISDDQVEDFFKSLPRGTTSLIGHYLMQQHGDDIKEWFENEDRDIDIDDANDVWDMIENFDDDLKSDMLSAVGVGYEAGTENQIQKALEECIEDGMDTLNETHMFVVFDNPENKFAYDTKCWLSLTQKDVIDLVSDMDNVQVIADEGWSLRHEEQFKMDEPHYGFGDYDRKSAIEYFFDDHPDFMPGAPARKAA